MCIANYKEHRQAFKALLETDCSKPILLFKGESGTGKSTLMKYCRTLIPSDSHQFLVDLRNTNNVMQIFLKTGARLGWDYFENFQQQIGELNRQLNINIDGNTQAGVGNMINVELKALFENTTPEQRAERYTALTYAWAKDINNLNKPCLLLLDVYEQAQTEIKGWIDGDFLSCAADSRQIRVVIAGQSIPESFEWSHCCEIKELDGVHEAEEWLLAIKAMGRVVPSPSPIELLRGFCIALNGNPAAIMKFIEKFPRAQ
jgi:energy-coupling factor transporter ATP-binding protein EcfA2